MHTRYRLVQQALLLLPPGPRAQKPAGLVRLVIFVKCGTLWIPLRYPVLVRENTVYLSLGGIACSTGSASASCCVPPPIRQLRDGERERGEGGGRTRACTSMPDARTVEMTSSTALRRRRWRILRVLLIRQGIFLRASERAGGREKREWRGRRHGKGGAHQRRPLREGEEERKGPSSIVAGRVGEVREEDDPRRAGARRKWLLPTTRPYVPLRAG